MKAKQAIAATLASVMVVSLLAGCGSASSSTGTGTSATADATTTDKAEADTATSTADAGTGENVNLTFWALSTRQDAYEPITEQWNSDHPEAQVTVSFYDTDGIKDACKVAASSNTLPSMWFNWGGSLGSFYSDNKLTYDLTDYSNEHDWANTYSSSALNLCTFDGQLIGIPTSYNVLGFYYRKDIFEKYGLEVPTTFDEFESVCAKLKENGVTPISTAGLNGWHVMRFIELLIEHYAGADEHDKMNSFDESWDNDYVTQAFEKYKEFVDKGYFPQGFLTADPNDTNLAVATGECAMDVQGQWYDGTITQNGGDPSQYGTFAFPSGGTNRLSSFAEMTQFNKSLSDAELESAIAFTQYMFSQEVADQYPSCYNLPLPIKGATIPDGNPNVGTLIETGENNGTFTITDQAFPTEVADVLFDCQDAVATGTMEPSDVGAKIQTAIESYLAK